MLKIPLNWFAINAALQALLVAAALTTVAAAPTTQPHSATTDQLRLVDVAATANQTFGGNAVLSSERVDEVTTLRYDHHDSGVKSADEEEGEPVVTTTLVASAEGQGSLSTDNSSAATTTSSAERESLTDRLQIEETTIVPQANDEMNETTAMQTIPPEVETTVIMPTTTPTVPTTTTTTTTTTTGTGLVEGAAASWHFGEYQTYQAGGWQINVNPSLLAYPAPIATQTPSRETSTSLNSHKSPDPQPETTTTQTDKQISVEDTTSIPSIPEDLSTISGDVVTTTTPSQPQEETTLQESTSVDNLVESVTTAPEQPSEEMFGKLQTTEPVIQLSQAVEERPQTPYRSDAAGTATTEKATTTPQRLEEVMSAQYQQMTEHLPRNADLEVNDQFVAATTINPNKDLTTPSAQFVAATTVNPNKDLTTPSAQFVVVTTINPNKDLTTPSAQFVAATTINPNEDLTTESASDRVESTATLTINTEETASTDDVPVVVSTPSPITPITKFEEEKESDESATRVQETEQSSHMPVEENTILTITSTTSTITSTTPTFTSTTPTNTSTISISTPANLLGTTERPGLDSEIYRFTATAERMATPEESDHIILTLTTTTRSPLEDQAKSTSEPIEETISRAHSVDLTAPRIPHDNMVFDQNEGGLKMTLGSPIYFVRRADDMSATTTTTTTTVPVPETKGNEMEKQPKVSNSEPQGESEMTNYQVITVSSSTSHKVQTKDESPMEQFNRRDFETEAKQQDLKAFADYATTVIPLNTFSPREATSSASLVDDHPTTAAQLIATEMVVDFKTESPSPHQSAQAEKEDPSRTTTTITTAAIATTTESVKEGSTALNTKDELVAGTSTEPAEPEVAPATDQAEIGETPRARTAESRALRTPPPKLEHFRNEDGVEVFYGYSIVKHN